jgi:imidazole glycerol-phosphate synthase subunit HisH
MIAVIDYECGNLQSLCQAISYLKAPYAIISDPAEVKNASQVILPGVGAFGAASQKLNTSGMGKVVKEFAATGKPLIGICLGMQLLADNSTEFGEQEGLGLIPGSVYEIPKGSENHSIRIPNIGWRKLVMEKDPTLFNGLELNDPFVYFVHSYYFAVQDDADISAWIAINGYRVPAIIHRDNVVGCQFHPEKSGPQGLAILKTILSL